MDQISGSAPAGSFIPLNDQEQRCYSALLTWCQIDSVGTVSASRVGELFRASQLPADTLRQVMEVCGAKQQGYFGPTQFQLSLKLLSAAQAGLPVRLESIRGELPLPRFYGLKNCAEDRYLPHSQHGDPRGPQWRGVDRSSSRHRDNSVEKQDPRVVSHLSGNSPPASPSNISTSTYSTQKNDADTLLVQSLHGPSWTVAQQDSSSPGHHESRLPVEHHTITQAYSAERLVDHIDYSDDPWRITEEQLEYYTNQFKSLQPDLGALILGAVAKDFFTKSKLPIPELSFIWELSDVDHDGALTFLEFCTAFHLIVARKNGFPLPESLPPSLQASLNVHDGAPSKLLGENSFFGIPFTQVEKVPVTSEKTEPLISFEETETIQEKNGVDKQSSLAEIAVSKESAMEEPSQSVAMSKRAGEVQDKASENKNTVTEMTNLVYKVDPHMRPRSRPRSYSSTSISDVVKKTEVPPTPPPRRQRTHSRASSLDLNKIFQQSSQGLKSVLLPFHPPPALPPRPPVTQIQHFIATAEQDSQKALQQADFADFSKFQEKERISEQNQLCKATMSTEDTISSKTVTGPAQQLLQKATHRKHRLESQNLDPDTSSFPAFTSGNKLMQKLSSRQKKEIQMAIRKNRESNAVLARLNSELQQQLKNVHQERIALESQLENLRPFAFL